MAEIVRYSNEFLPHIIRLLSPGVQADGQLDYYRQLFALHKPDPPQACLMVKGSDRILAFTHMASMEHIRPGLVNLTLAVDSQLSAADWNSFWRKCCQLASQNVQARPIFQLAVQGKVPLFLEKLGFVPVRTELELQADLGTLPPVQKPEPEEFRVISLAENPQLESQWLDLFNRGLTVFWDVPPLDAVSLQRLRQTPGFDPAAFRLGMGDGEPVTANFYSVIDSNLGIVRINAAATPSGKRSRGYGRWMIKDTLNHLEEQGYKTVIIYTSAANQATSLLFKMLGFKPTGKIQILEWSGGGATESLAGKEAAATQEELQADAGSAQADFFPVSSSIFERRNNGK